MGFYPDTDGNGFQFYTSFFGATNCFNSAGKYDFASCTGAQAEMNWIASFDKYPYAQVMALQTALGYVAGGQTDIFTNGKSGFELSGPWVGAQNVPVVQPGPRRPLRRRGLPGDRPQAEHARPGQLQHHPQGLRAPGSGLRVHLLARRLPQRELRRIHRPEGRLGARRPLGDQGPGVPGVAEANSWLSGFLPQMTSPYTQAPLLTPTQAQLFTAENTATANVLQKIMTPAQALKYIDQQANASS